MSCRRRTYINVSGDIDFQGGPYVTISDRNTATGNYTTRVYLYRLSSSPTLVDEFEVMAAKDSSGKIYSGRTLLSPSEGTSDKYTALNEFFGTSSSSYKYSVPTRLNSNNGMINSNYSYNASNVNLFDTIYESNGYKTKLILYKNGSSSYGIKPYIDSGGTNSNNLIGGGSTERIDGVCRIGEKDYLVNMKRSDTYGDGLVKMTLNSSTSASFELIKNKHTSADVSYCFSVNSYQKYTPYIIIFYPNGKYYINKDPYDFTTTWIGLHHYNYGESGFFGYGDEVYNSIVSNSRYTVAWTYSAGYQFAVIDRSLEYMYIYNFDLNTNPSDYGNNLGIALSGTYMYFPYKHDVVRVKLSSSNYIESSPSYTTLSFNTKAYHAHCFNM